MEEIKLVFKIERTVISTEGGEGICVGDILALAEELKTEGAPHDVAVGFVGRLESISDDDDNGFFLMGDLAVKFETTF